MSIAVAMRYAESMLGIPYIWGGNNPLIGLDCSGFTLEVLRSIGQWDKHDDTAQGIRNTFSIITRKPISEGTLLFFGKTAGSITHVAIALNDKYMIEAGGGGSTTLTVEDAKKQNAFVRIRPIANRSDLVDTIPNLGLK